METHRITPKTAKVPDIGEIVLIVADEKNRGEWKKGKVVRHIRGKGGINSAILRPKLVSNCTALNNHLCSIQALFVTSLLCQRKAIFYCVVTLQLY